MHLLLVEGDPALASFLVKGLQLDGHDVAWVDNSKAALDYASHHQPNLIILDLDSHQCAAARVLNEMHSKFQNTAVLVITASQDSQERAHCLRMGADDCLVKPFSFAELSARCQAILRRHLKTPNYELEFAGITMDLAERRARYGKREIDLTGTEFELLAFLIRKRGAACTRADLLRDVWNIHDHKTTNVLNVCMAHLRLKIAAAMHSIRERPNLDIIETLHGVGYRIRPHHGVELYEGHQPLPIAKPNDAAEPPVHLLLRQPKENPPRTWGSSNHTRTLGRRVLLASAGDPHVDRLKESLIAMRWSVSEASGGAEAITLLDEHTHDVALLGRWFPDLEMGWLSEELQRRHPKLDVLPIQGDATESTVRSPWRHELLHALREAQSESKPALALSEPQDSEMTRITLASGNAVVANTVAADAIGGPNGSSLITGTIAQESDTGIEGMIGDSAPMRELTRLIRMVAPRNVTVLIEGETGTGKEIVAQSLHRLSRRAGKTFVVLNCAAIPEQLLEAELFGHTRGAFTGAVAPRIGRIESAHGGTLFLDEIGELPLGVQAKLLRFLENGDVQRIGSNDVARVDVRILAATHQRLEERAGNGSFRLDLYHRLAVFPLEVPALRSRIEDIQALAQHFLGRMRHGNECKRLSGEALRLLSSFSWPGNVRELAHVLERAAILAEDDTMIRDRHIRLPWRSQDLDDHFGQ